MAYDRKLDIEAIVIELNEVLNLGYASVVENYKGIPSRIKITKSGRIAEKDDIVEEVNRKISNIKIVDQIFDFLEEKGFEEDFLKKRIYRKGGTGMNDPDASPQAEINRLGRKITPRVSQDHAKLFEECAKHFSKKGQALEKAIELLAKDLEL